jgi:hypothetical protein
MRLSLIALSALFAAALLVKRTTGPQAIVRQIAIEWNKGVAFACIKIDRGYQCGLVSSIEHGPRLLRYPFQFLLRHCMDLAFTYDLWISLYAYVSNNYVGATDAKSYPGRISHHTRPNVSSGATQAEYFLVHGGRAHNVSSLTLLVAGGWTSDGITLRGTSAGPLVSEEPSSVLLLIRKNYRHPPEDSRLLIFATAPAFSCHRWLQRLSLMPTSRRQ